MGIGTLIELEGIFDIGFATGLDEANELIDVKWDVTKLYTNLPILYCDDGVLCPGVGMKLVIGELPVVCQADAAGIDVPGGVSEATKLLGMGVSTRHERGIEAAK